MAKAHWLVSALALGLGLAAILLVTPKGSLAQPMNIDIDVVKTATKGSGAASGSGGPVGSTFVINGENGTQVRPAVAYNSQAGEYLVVWHNEWPANKDVYAQRVSKDGTLVGPRRVISPVGGQRYNPDVAYNSQHDEYLVVWEDGLNIQGQRVSATGVCQGDVITIATGYLGLDSCTQPAVAYAYTSDRYLVVWEYGSLVGKSIDAQVLEWDGSAVAGGDFDIVPYTFVNPPEKPDVAYNRTLNELLVVWQQVSGTYYDVFGRRVRMAGVLGVQGASFPIIDWYEPDVAPAVAAIPKPVGVGQYLVVAEHSFVGRIYAQRVTGLGVKDGSPITIAVGGPSAASNPAVAGNESTEQYLVVWSQPSTGTPVFTTTVGRLVSTGGDLLSAEMPIDGEDADHAAVAAGPLGGFLVAWDDAGNDRDVYGRLWGIRIHLPLVMRSAQ